VNSGSRATLVPALAKDAAVQEGRRIRGSVAEGRKLERDSKNIEK
jgi:hypothetical protein